MSANQLDARKRVLGLIPTDEDKKASELGREIDKLINLSTKKDSSAFRLLLPKIEDGIKMFDAEREGKFQPKKDSPYQNFLYQQILRANSRGLLMDSLARAQSPAKLINITHDVINDSFRDVERDAEGLYQYSHDRDGFGRKFSSYCHSNDPDAQQNFNQLFIKFYDTANREIGAQTQKSHMLKKTAKTFLTSIGGFMSAKPLGQKKDYFFRHDEDKHDLWQSQFLNACRSVEAGEPLTTQQLGALGFVGDDKLNPYYAMPQFSDEDNVSEMIHIGHASALLRLGEFSFISDPLHYQSGTDGVFLTAGAKMAYPRNTEPAFKTQRYPGGQIVWISHNHHDHLCKSSLKESFPPDTILIVPAGDGKLIKSWGFSQVIEINSWNEVVDLKLKDEGLKIHAIPAKHASNRSLFDYMKSLFMGCIVEHTNSDQQSIRHLISGDTAVLDEEHYRQLHEWVLKHGLIRSASVASGPDRPREWMECTHQSSADALVFQARLTVANLEWFSSQSQDNQITSVEKVKEYANYTIAYHQGCYRLGLLSYSDVITTVTRILAFLDSLPKEVSIDQLLDDASKHNFYWVVMDSFEREGVENLLKVYQEIKITAENKRQRCLTNQELTSLISATFHIPKIGGTSQLKADKPNPGFTLDLENMIVNGPAKKQIEYQINRLTNVQPRNLLDLLETLQKVFTNISFSENKKITFQRVLQREEFKLDCERIDLTHPLSHDAYRRCLDCLGKLTSEVQGEQTYDNGIREEGNFQTMMIMTAQRCKSLIISSSLEFDEELGFGGMGQMHQNKVTPL